MEPDGYSDEARAVLEQAGVVDDGPLTREEMLKRIADYDVAIVRLGHAIDREMIEAGGRLRAIVSATTGLDHIDLSYASEHEVAILSLRGEDKFLRSVSATAEHTWALLLSMIRNIPAAVESVRLGEWDRDRFKGRELNGKRLGILGLGRLGRKVARYALAFDMQVFAYDPHAEEWIEGVERLDSIQELMSVSDVLSVHVPLNDETEGMVGAAELEMLPPGAWLVNTARGAIVSEEALVDVLESGHLAGAAIDVVDNEREPGRRVDGRLLKYFLGHRNLVITPHVSGATYESMANTEMFMARKLLKFLEDPLSVLQSQSDRVDGNA